MPEWLDVARCAGYWTVVPSCVLLVASLQFDVLRLSIAQPPTLAVIFMTSCFVAGNISLYTFGLDRSLWLDLPRYPHLVPHKELRDRSFLANCNCM